MPTAANDDLAALSDMNQDILLHELESRYSKDQIYVSCKLVLAVHIVCITIHACRLTLEIFLLLSILSRLCPTTRQE